MARRSIWNGAISFGMVVIPVKLYPATDSKDISFVNLHSTCENRIRQPRFCSHHETTVESSEIIRAYEYAKDQYIKMADSDFDDLPVPSRHAIDITQFVDLANVDPIFYDKSYSLEPQEIGVKPFYLLKQALESSGRVAIAKISIRQKENLCLLRPYEQGLMMETMHYPDEVRGMNELNLPEEEAEFTKQEMDMAATLIDQLTGEFDPGLYRDEYRIALERVIEAKLTGSEPVTATPVSSQGKVGNLMDALRASIESTKSERSAKKTGSQGKRLRKNRLQRNLPKPRKRRPKSKLQVGQPLA